MTLYKFADYTRRPAADSTSGTSRAVNTAAGLKWIDYRKLEMIIVRSQMNIPSYWAVHTLDVPFKNKTTTIKRYGWSNDSVKSAKKNAIERCEQAKHTLLTTGNVKRIEPKGSYWVEGLPIREEVVQKYPELNCATTINIYGSTCLNSEDVMILDIDNDDLQSNFISKARRTKHSKPKNISLFWALLPIVLLLIVANMLGGKIEGGLRFFLLGVIGGLLAMLLSYINTWRLNKWWRKQGGHDGMLDSFVKPFIDKYPDMVFNIYKTPLGFRLLALDNTYLPTDINVQRCFDELPVDKKYARLCQLQNCFRARVTAKPWNIENCEPRIPFRDFWVDNAEQRERQEWLKHYHELESSYAACRFIKQVGDRPSVACDSHHARIYTHIDMVVALHDTLSKSRSQLPIA